MAYTVECRERLADELRITVIGGFEDAALGQFFDELGVEQETWSRWHQALLSGEWLAVIPQCPQLSMLASADEGKIHFKGQDLRKLQDECEYANGRVVDDRARAILTHLQEGTSLAIKRKGEVVVHPFGD